jgi:hypothetical protein
MADEDRLITPFLKWQVCLRRTVSTSVARGLLWKSYRLFRLFHPNKNGTLLLVPNAEGEKPTPTPYLIHLTAPD